MIESSKPFQTPMRAAFAVAIAPAPKDRPRFSGSPRPRRTSATKARQLAIANAARGWLRSSSLQAPLWSWQPIALDVLAVFPRPQVRPTSIPAAMWEQKGLCPRPATPDFDNVAKLVSDALNGVLWSDDAQVCDGRCATVYAEPNHPSRIEVVAHIITRPLTHIVDREVPR